MSRFFIANIFADQKVWVLIVPRNWLIGNKLAYPDHYNGNRQAQAARKEEQPTSSYTIYEHFKIQGEFGRIFTFYSTPFDPFKIFFFFQTFNLRHLALKN